MNTNDTNTNDTNTNNGAHAAFCAMESALRTQFVEREDAIHLMLVSALSNEHLALIGPPGEAKSALLRAFCKAVQGGSLFEYLLTRFTQPDELFGPFSLKGLQQDDAFRRNTTGMLPEAMFAFLDEIFKANSACLNSLLPALNERVFFDDGKRKPMGLRFVMGASNELPQQGEGLAAVWDRFQLRIMIPTIDDDAAFSAVLRNGVPAITERITVEQWDEARREVSAVTVDDEAIAGIAALRRVLREDGIAPSTRRWVKSKRVLQAHAWLCGDNEVTDDHFGIYEHMLWDMPEQRAVIADRIAASGNSVVQDARNYAKAVQELLAKTESREDKAAALREIGECGKRVSKLLAGTAEGTRVHAKVERVLNDLRSLHREVRAQVVAAYDLGEEI